MTIRVARKLGRNIVMKARAQNADATMAFLRLGLRQSDSGKFRIGKDDARDQRANSALRVTGRIAHRALSSID